MNIEYGWALYEEKTNTFFTSIKGIFRNINCAVVYERKSHAVQVLDNYVDKITNNRHGVIFRYIDPNNVMVRVDGNNIDEYNFKVVKIESTSILHSIQVKLDNAKRHEVWVSAFDSIQDSIGYTCTRETAMKFKSREECQKTLSEIKDKYISNRGFIIHIPMVDRLVASTIMENPRIIEE